MMKYTSAAHDWASPESTERLGLKTGFLHLGYLSFKCLSHVVDALIAAFGHISCWQKSGLSGPQWPGLSPSVECVEYTVQGLGYD